MDCPGLRKPRLRHPLVERRVLAHGEAVAFGQGQDEDVGVKELQVAG